MPGTSPEPRPAVEAGPRSQPFSLRFTAGLAAWILRGLSATWRMRFVDDLHVRSLEASRSPFVLALWHRHLIGMLRTYRGRGLASLVSWSKDGEIAARTASHLGYATSRGSTSRAGGAGMLGLLRLARKGHDLAFTPDGPRGPAARVQPGVLIVAQILQWPVIPVAVAAPSCWRLRSWDRMLVPGPFARVWVAFGQPLDVPKGADLTALAAELERRIDAVEATAETAAAGAAAAASTRVR